MTNKRVVWFTRDELNIFEGLGRNPMFIGIVFFIIILQIILISVGGVPFMCYKLGLNWGNWGISILFGLGSLLWGFFLKFISEDKCMQFGKKQVHPLNNQSRVLSLRGNREDASMSRKYSSIIHPMPPAARWKIYPNSYSCFLHNTLNCIVIKLFSSIFTKESEYFKILISFLFIFNRNIFIHFYMQKDVQILINCFIDIWMRIYEYQQQTH